MPGTDFILTIIREYGITSLVFILIIYFIYTKGGKFLDIIIERSTSSDKKNFDKIKKSFEDVSEIANKQKKIIERFKMFDYSDVKNHDLFSDFVHLNEIKIPIILNSVTDEVQKMKLHFIQCSIKSMLNTFDILTSKNDFLDMSFSELKTMLYDIKKNTETEAQYLFKDMGYDESHLTHLTKVYYELILFRDYLMDSLLKFDTSISNAIKIWLFLSIRRSFIYAILDETVIFNETLKKMP